MKTLPKRILRNAYSCPTVENVMHPLNINTQVAIIVPVEIEQLINSSNKLTCRQVNQLSVLNALNFSDEIIRQMKKAMQWQSERIEVQTQRMNLSTISDHNQLAEQPVKSQAQRCIDIIMIEKQMEQYIMIPFRSASNGAYLYDDPHL